MDKATPKLRECPFCGKSPKKSVNHKGYYFCSNDCTYPMDINTWNTRSYDKHVAQIKELRQVLKEINNITQGSAQGTYAYDIGKKVEQALESTESI
jgi:endogenous inhibitor of DNA gyrase (YacG/DUF329 family)